MFVHTYRGFRAILLSVNPNTLYSFCYTPLVTKIPSPNRTAFVAVLFFFRYSLRTPDNLSDLFCEKLLYLISNYYKIEIKDVYRGYNRGKREYEKCRVHDKFLECDVCFHNRHEESLEYEYEF